MAMQQTESASPETVKTSIGEKVAYGMGDVACNVVFALTSGLVVYFYTNVMGISAGLVGMIMLASRVFDGISDVAIGAIMDRVNSKHGKARAWILWMSVPYGLTAIALFCIPAGATELVQGIYIFITYNLCTTVVYTALNLPYGAMVPMMTRNGQDRAVLNIFRMAMSPIGNMIVTACTLPFINRMGGDQRAWIIVTAIYSVIAFGMLIWCFLGCKERVHTKAAKEAESMPLSVRVKAMLKNKYFIMILLSSGFLALYQTINGVCSTYYAQYILGNNELMGVMQIAENIPQVLVIMTLAPFIKKFGKRNLVLWGALLVIAGQVMLLAAPDNYHLILGAAVMRGVGKAPLFGCVFTMIADVIEYGHWKTDIRVQALLFSSVTVGQKFGGGIASAFIGRMMDLSGFTGAQVEIPSAVAMVQNLYIFGTIAAWVVIAALMGLYHLDKEYDGIMKDLRVREGA